MDNRNIEEAKRYHEITKHSYQSVRQSAHYLDWDNRPLVYKIHPGLSPIPLPRDFPAPKADTVQAVGGAGCNEEKAPGLKELSQILFFSAGETKKKIYPGGEEYHFRAAACAGALYPIEIYVVSTDIPGLEAGIYHFNPGDFALRRLRSGDYRPELAGTAGDNQAIAAAPVTLVLSAIFWRSAWKYQARCYRYCFWDGGTILANLLAVMASEQISCSLEMGFVDSKVNHLLGLDAEREASLCLVPLGRSMEWAGHAVGRELPALNYEAASLSEHEVDYPALKRMHAASCLAADEETRPWRGPCLRPQPEAKNPAVPLEQPLERSSPLGEVILKRGYRAAQLEAGIIGGKLYLSAYSLGLGASGLTFYDDDVVKFFSPHATGKDAIFVVALGKAEKRVKGINGLRVQGKMQNANLKMQNE